MELRREDREIICYAKDVLHKSIHNMNCLSEFLKKEYPSRSSLSDIILFMGLIRMLDLESIGIFLKYPVFGKECEQLTHDELKELLISSYNLDRYGYLDYSDNPNGMCLNQDLYLYEVEL